GVSRYGGVRAVVLLPEELWTMEEIPPVQPVPTASSAASATSASSVQEAPVSEIRRAAESRPAPGATSRTMHGLPKRGARQAPIASVPDPDATAPAPRTSGETGRASGRSLGALQRGTLSGRNLDATSFEGPEEA
ncbi:ATP-binding protein, partial [Streptomyces sp. NPDC002812]